MTNEKTAKLEQNAIFQLQQNNTHKKQIHNLNMQNNNVYIDEDINIQSEQNIYKNFQTNNVYNTEFINTNTYSNLKLTIVTKLPKQELPKFFGDLIDFKSF